MDGLIRGLTEDKSARFVAAVTTLTADEARRRHGTKAGSTRILAEALTGSALLWPTIHGDEKLSLQMTGSGPVRAVLVDIDSHGNLRGCVENPAVMSMPGVDHTLLGDQGVLMVMRSTPQQVVSRGTVPLFAGEVAADLALYLSTSEQVPSAIVVQATVSEDPSVVWAGGILVQAMPGEDPTAFEVLKTILEMPDDRADILRGEPTPERLIEALFDKTHVGFKALERAELRFQCSCSLQKVTEMLAMLAPRELREMRDEDGGAEVTCRFCGHQYKLDAEDLTVLLADTEDVN